jgi:hypothetical protein
MIWRRLALALSLSVILAGCQSSQPLQVEPQPERTHPQLADPVRHAGSPAGSVTVAYPSEPSTLFRPTGEEAAVDDLGALWGLPLLRLDGAGQVRRGLAIDWTVADPDARPWFVELTLAEGTWSDGTPVTAEDVVTTLERRRAADPARFGAIQATEVVEGRVRVAFDEHHATWPDLLVEIGGVIPAHLDDTAFEDDIPVSGGWFHLAERIPGLSLRFEAHSDSPLGPPRLQDVEVLFVPNDETALGLLDAGRVDAVLGHLSINSVARAQSLVGVTAGAPLGGTLVMLDYQPSGALGGSDRADLRRGVGETTGLQELVEGLVGVAGSVAASPWATVDDPLTIPPGEVREGQSMTVLFPRDVGILGFAVRVMQRDLQARGIATTVIAEVDPRLHQQGPTETDAALTVRRLPPRPALGRWLDDPAAGQVAGVIGDADHPDVQTVLEQVAREHHVTPLFRMGVLHAWRGIDGIRPSSWPGIGFWNVGDWTRPS